MYADRNALNARVKFRQRIFEMVLETTATTSSVIAGEKTAEMDCALAERYANLAVRELIEREPKTVRMEQWERYFEIALKKVVEFDLYKESQVEQNCERAAKYADTALRMINRTPISEIHKKPTEGVLKIVEVTILYMEGDIKFANQYEGNNYRGIGSVNRLNSILKEVCRREQRENLPDYTKVGIKFGLDNGQEFEERFDVAADGTDSMVESHFGQFITFLQSEDRRDRMFKALGGTQDVLKTWGVKVQVARWLGIEIPTTVEMWFKQVMKG